jgi:hypothetical protein
MRSTCLCLSLLVAGCAHSAGPDPAFCCSDPGEQAPWQGQEGHDFAERIEAPARCEAAARTRLASSPDEAWRQLWGCVLQGHFTALRNLLGGAWDRELQTRPDAPFLVARVIAERGGDVDGDLRLVHDRRVPLFALSQALARPDQLRGALVIVRARVSPRGVLDETRLVSQTWDVPLGPSERVITRAPAPFSSDTRRVITSRRGYNLDVATGARVMALVERDPFLDEDDAQVVLARFEGLRDGDAWPVVSVLSHFRPSPTVSY